MSRGRGTASGKILGVFFHLPQKEQGRLSGHLGYAMPFSCSGLQNRLSLPSGGAALQPQWYTFPSGLNSHLPEDFINLQPS